MSTIFLLLLQSYYKDSSITFDICSAEEYEAVPKLDLAALNAAKTAAAARIADAVLLRLLIVLLAFVVQFL